MVPSVVPRDLVAVTTSVSRVTTEFVERGRIHGLHDKSIPPYVSVFKIQGPFLFGAADTLSKVTEHLDALPETVILRLRYMTTIDGTGLRGLEDLADLLRQKGAHADHLRRARSTGCGDGAARIHAHLGDKNICPNIAAALERAEELDTARAA